MFTNICPLCIITGTGMMISTMITDILQIHILLPDRELIPISIHMRPLSMITRINRICTTGMIIPGNNSGTGNR
jgi:hypothetical protein